MSKKTKTLFDDDGSSSDDDDDDENNKEVTKERLSVNKRFAKDYQSRKQQEELRNARFDGNGSENDSSSDDESEDEDGNLLTPHMDVSILKTINALRKKDDSIYNPETKFFTEETSTTSKPKKAAKKHFKDVLREQVLEQIDDEEKGTSKSKNKHLQEATDRLAYDEEQKNLRSAFLVDDEDESSGDDNDMDNMLVVKKRAEPIVMDDVLEKEYEALQKNKGANPVKDPRGEVQDGDGFLIDFLKNKKWLDKDDDIYADDDDEDDAPRRNNNSDNDSIDDVDRADDFEQKYNFRFEEAQSEIKSGADFSIMPYARSGTMDTLRRKDDSRRQARLERKERKASERKAKEEQLRRLKNAKREEMESKLKEIKKVLGAVNNKDGGDEGEAGAVMDEDAMMKLMEGDYDPDKFEKLMQATYGDDFYEKEDSQWKSDKDVRASLLTDEDGNQLVGEDDVDGGLYDNDEAEENAEEDGENDEEEEEEYYGEEEGGDYDEDELTAPAESKLEQKLKSKMQEELYKLDYEDIVAGMPTRFKYRKVEKNSYGLSTSEILLARDATLKNFVSLKKMAPYRDAEEAEYSVGYKKRRRFRDMLKEDLEAEKPAAIEAEAEDEAQDGKSKKRRRQKKGKKKDKDDEPSAKDEEAVEGDDEKPSTEAAEPAGGKKRRRKKKGKKGDKSAEPVAETNDEDVEETPEEPVDPEKAKAAEKKAAKKAKQKAKRKLLDLEDPDRKKSKKNKKTKIEGVSASRLEAYGL